jgi:hypothetical protein
MTEWTEQRAAFQRRFDTLAQDTGSFTEQHRSYKVLYSDIMTAVSNQASQYDVTQSLEDHGSLQQKVLQLEKIQQSKKEEVDTALARDTLLRSSDRRTTSHQLFLLDRPVRRERIPYLLVLSVLCIGISVYVFKMAHPTLATEEAVGSLWGLSQSLAQYDPLPTYVGIFLLVVAVVMIALTLGGIL